MRRWFIHKLQAPHYIEVYYLTGISILRHRNETIIELPTLHWLHAMPLYILTDSLQLTELAEVLVTYSSSPTEIIQDGGCISRVLICSGGDYHANNPEEIHNNPEEIHGSSSHQ